MTHWTDAADLIGERDEGAPGSCRPLCAGRAGFRPQRGARSLPRLFPAVPAAPAAAGPLRSPGGRLAFRRACAAPQACGPRRRFAFRRTCAGRSAALSRPRRQFTPPIPSARWCSRDSARPRGLTVAEAPGSASAFAAGRSAAFRRGGRAAAAAPAERARPNGRAGDAQFDARNGRRDALRRAIGGRSPRRRRVFSRNCSEGREARPPRRRSQTLAYAAPPPVSSPAAAPRSPGVAAWAVRAAGSATSCAASPSAPNPTSRFGDHVAVYDISARMVYLPDGTRIEAHSGLGNGARRSLESQRAHARPDPAGDLCAVAARSSVPWRRRPAADARSTAASSAARACSPIPTCWGRTATPTAASRSGL